MLILCVILVISGTLIGLGAGSKETEKATSDPVEPEVSFFDDPNLGNDRDLDFAGRDFFFKMMLSVGLVIGLGGAALYLSKRVLPKVTRTSGKEIHVLETSYLGPRKALHLVEVGSHRLLIGSTNESITPLAHVTEAWIEMSKRQMDDTVDV